MIDGNQNILDGNEKKIDARPTKELFIEILVRDILLKNAILDLIDNSVDGALRIRKNKKYSGLNIRLEISRDKFRIVDNCGGMSVQIARDFAFRFGRPDEMEHIINPVLGSIGEFGVGMKRTLFKLGNKFSVNSVEENSHFSMKVNVEEWKKEIGDWKFEFSEVQEDEENPEDNWKTDIEVLELYPEISDSLGNDNFIRGLIQEVENAHVEALDNGLAITINQIPARANPLSLFSSKYLPPAFRKDLHRVGKNKEDVNVKIFAGVGESEPNEAGWYIFCNGRVILSANQSSVTGWGNEPGAPKYHNQYSRFRGYVFIDSDNPGLLPWNTTKTGINEESMLYKAVKLNMVSIMKSIISFLNKLDSESTAYKEMVGDEGPLMVAINSSSLKNIYDIKTSNLAKTFRPNVIHLPLQSPEYGTIKFRKPKKDIDKIKKILKVKSNKEVGEMTFDYFFDSEVPNE